MVVSVRFEGVDAPRGQAACASERVVAGALGMGGEERPRQPGQFPPRRQPFAQRQRLSAVPDRGFAVQAQRVEHRLDQRRRVARPHPERIAGLVVQAGVLERQLEVADVAAAARSGDALRRQDRGRERRLARGRRRRRRLHAQRGDGGQRPGRVLRRILQRGQRLRPPGRGDGVDVQVGVAARQQPARAELVQARIERLAHRAEPWIARIAQAQHRVVELLQPRRAPSHEELVQPARVVRRIAVALGADHQREVALVLQFAHRIGVGAQQADRQPGLPRIGFQLRGHAPGVAGLAAVDDGQARRRDGLGARRRRGDGLLRGAAGSQSRGVAGQPPQPALVELAGEAVRGFQPLRGRRRGGMWAGRGHGRPGLRSSFRRAD
jgi:hypothetical protein